MRYERKRMARRTHITLSLALPDLFYQHHCHTTPLCVPSESTPRKHLSWSIYTHLAIERYIEGKYVYEYARVCSSVSTTFRLAISDKHVYIYDGACEDPQGFLKSILQSLQFHNTLMNYEPSLVIWSICNQPAVLHMKITFPFCSLSPVTHKLTFYILSWLFTTFLLSTLQTPHTA